MRELNKIKLNHETGDVLSTPTQKTDELITIEECKEYLGKFNLSDQQVSEMRNYLVGVIDKALSSYLEGFK